MTRKPSKRIRLTAMQSRREQSLQLRETDPEPEMVYAVLAERRMA